MNLKFTFHGYYLTLLLVAPDILAKLVDSLTIISQTDEMRKEKKKRFIQTLKFDTIKRSATYTSDRVQKKIWWFIQNHVIDTHYKNCVWCLHMTSQVSPSPPPFHCTKATIYSQHQVHKHEIHILTYNIQELEKLVFRCHAIFCNDK